MTETLHINQTINIIIEKGSYKGRYVSKVADATDNLYKITPPFVNGEILPLHINRIIKISYNGPDAVYEFMAKVIERQKEQVPLLVVEKISKINRRQRREFFRVEAKIKVKYRVVKDEANKVENKFKETTTIDLSAGGLRISLIEPLPLEEILELYIDLPEIKKTAIYGKVVNHYPLSEGQAAGVEFIGIDENDQDKIVSWLFDYQRKQRKKGLL